MRVLIAEDQASSRLLLQSTLQHMGHEVTAVEDGQQAWDVLQRDYFPVLISDWIMPNMDGLELCRQIRAAHNERYTYIIVLSARDGRTDYLEGMAAGADDFISKPLDEDQLAARLTVAARILDLHETLRTRAMYDPLTGLLNRAAITERLAIEMARAGREGKALSVVLVDLDRFKQVNDTHGHAVGDVVLQETAERMKSCMRAYDSIGRYGGEEFLIVAPGSAPQDSLQLAERVRSCICEDPVSTPQGQLQVTCSLGAAGAAVAPNEDPGAMVRRADAALYRAKAGGRNRSELAVEDVPETS